jgi:uncharacterized membrane protein YqjE
MESGIFNILLGLVAVLSFVWSVFSEQYRIIAIVLGFVLIIVMILSEQNSKIQNLVNEQKKLEEKLKIHEQLIDIKSDIKELQKKVFKK